MLAGCGAAGFLLTREVGRGGIRRGCIADADVAMSARSQEKRNESGS